MNLQVATREAVDLFREGTLALALAEEIGGRK